MSAHEIASVQKGNAAASFFKVRASILRRMAFNFDHACSIGLSSGEYGGWYNTLAPAATMLDSTPSA